MPHRVRDTDTLTRTLRIRRNLDQAAVGIPAIDRAQRPARALFCYRPLFDCHAAGVEMRDHRCGGRPGKKAEIVTARGLVVGGEPFDLVGVARPHIDLLAAEYQRGARRPATARIEYCYLHAEYLAIPRRRTRDVRDIDDEVIEGMDLDGHGLSFRRTPRGGV